MSRSARNRPKSRRSPGKAGAAKPSGTAKAGGRTAPAGPARTAAAVPGSARRTAPPAPAPTTYWTAAWPRWKVSSVAAGLFLLGVLGGVVGAFLHLGTLQVGVELPVGVVFALLCAAAFGVAGGVYVGTRAGAIIPALAWVLTVLVLTQPRAEGDLIVGSSPSGFAFILGGLVTQGLVVMVPPYADWSRADRPGRAR